MAVTDSKAAGRKPRLLRRLGRPGQPADGARVSCRRGHPGRPAGGVRVARRRGRRGQDAGGAGVTTTFLRWTFLRAVFHRGYVLASGLYFVLAAHLSAAQLVLLGTVMALTLLVSDIPAGVWSATIRVPWPGAVQTVDGVRYLRPEIVLLYKARLDRPKDRADLAAAALDADARAWLAETLDRLGHHTWANLARGKAAG